MHHDSQAVHSELESDSPAQFVHALIQFAMTVRYRKNIVILSVIVAMILGGLYFATATRRYQAGAELLVMQTGADKLQASVASNHNPHDGLMRTHEALIKSRAVIDQAIQYIPPEYLVHLKDMPRETWPELLEEQLTSGVVRETNILQLHCRSKEPPATVAIINAIVQSYIEFLDRTHRGTIKEVIQVLSKERAELAQRLAEKEQELLRAREALGDMEIPDNSIAVHPVVKRAMYFNEELIKVQRLRVELTASLAALEAAIRNGDNLQQHILSVAETVGEEILLRAFGFDAHDAATQAALERSLLEDRAQLRTLQEHLGPEHPEVKSLLTQMRETEAYLLTYRDRVQQRIAKMNDTTLGETLRGIVRQNLAETTQLETSLQMRFEQAQSEAIALNGAMAQLEMLKHDLTWLRDLHDVLLNRIATIDLKQDGTEIRVAVVKDPVVPEKPASPNLKFVILAALVGGLAIGFGLVWVVDTLDDRFRSMDELQEMLGVNVLTIIRQLSTYDAAGAEALQVHIDPASMESESFRTLRTALALADQEAQQIVVSSSEPGDGKTTVIANLAATYAQASKRTLMIDADLRRPGLTALMGMRGVEGLSGIIRGEGNVLEMAAAHIRATGIDRLDFLPSGPRPTNPAELLASQRFSEMLAWAQTVYDQILIDSPPALATSDAAVIGRLVDGVVLVIQPDKNRRKLVSRATELFMRLKIPVLGIVCNRVGSDKDRSYGYNGDFAYKYDYSYGPDDDADSPRETTEVTTHVIDASVPGVDHHEAPARPVVPRRVA